ncbi:MAG: aspartate-semialdehyde dehydrogenase [Mesoaciditoga sp.]|uniref:aspartate-semialdehyde dehydrogenase n=1 Tax=Athalassotoga sp. TaxID=2022597 RepID=UPI000CCB03C7|nr:MAG: aspartate-semialdehyde dehydrogenase [Mesoaciditoga sp.]HEU25097.1 aspartate-semialdehyde dehydrogenase [Mesoaciditoga lauensis]
MKAGVVGATGEVGRTMVKVLEERGHVFDEFRLFASERSKGVKIPFHGENISVEILTEEAMKDGFDFLLFSAGKEISKHFAPIASDCGTTVIDNSSAFRMDPKIPLVVPDVNSHVLKNYRGIIANPNCSTIQLVMALKPLHDLYRLKHVVVTTMQAVSGSGHKGIEELEMEMKGDIIPKVYPKQIAYNCIPQIGPFLENGFSEEEMKMYNETRKIMECDCVVEATTVRVPVFYGHSESVWAEFENPFDLNGVLKAWKNTPYVKVWDDYPTPVEIKGSDLSHVGRVRISPTNALMFWNVADNVRVGAATNAVKILEYFTNAGR